MSSASGRPTMGPMRIGVAVVAVVCVCALVSGCGGGEAGPSTAGEPIALEQLTRSAEASATATSGRFAFAMEFSGPGGDELSFSGEGAFDKASERASFVADMSAFAELLGGFFSAFARTNVENAPDFDDPEAWKIEVVQDGKVSYVRFPAVSERLPAGTSWVRSDGERVKVDGFEFGELDGIASTDPREVLDLLQAAGAEIETVGREELRGTETTHYRGTLDAAAYAKKLSPGERAGLGPLAGQLDAGAVAVPVDVWLDGDGFVRKVSLSISGTELGREGSASVSFELWDYGEKVEIDLPPADEVVDASALRS